MAVLSKAEKSALEETFRISARKMYFSKSSIGYYLNNATIGQITSVVDLLEYEMQTRDKNRKAKLLRQARFPLLKSIEDFDFSDISFPQGYAKEDMLSLEFIDHAQDFVFFGKTGRGKTHLMIALGMMCVNKGMSVKFFSAADLVLQLVRANEAGKLDTFLRDIHKADIVLLDEFGYIPIDAEGARLLFQVISASYETKSLIITTNIEFSKWATVLADEKLAAATVDRIVHHGRLIEFGGNSRRLDNALMLEHIDKAGDKS